MGFEPVWMFGAENRQQLPKIDSHPAFDRMLQKMPAAARSSFSAEQLALLAEVSKPRAPRHWVDYRVSMPFFGGRYYLTLFFGKERRLLSRIRSEGQASLAKTSVVYVAVLWVLISIGLLSSLVLLYVIKSAMGIDMFSGPSFLHEFAFLRIGWN